MNQNQPKQNWKTNTARSFLLRYLQWLGHQRAEHCPLRRGFQWLWGKGPWLQIPWAVRISSTVLFAGLGLTSSQIRSPNPFAIFARKRIPVELTKSLRLRTGVSSKLRPVWRVFVHCHWWQTLAVLAFHLLCHAYSNFKWVSSYILVFSLHATCIK